MSYFLRIMFKILLKYVWALLRYKRIYQIDCFGWCLLLHLSALLLSSFRLGYFLYLCTIVSAFDIKFVCFWVISQLHLAIWSWRLKWLGMKLDFLLFVHFDCRCIKLSNETFLVCQRWIICVGFIVFWIIELMYFPWREIDHLLPVFFLDGTLFFMQAELVFQIQQILGVALYCVPLFTKTLGWELRRVDIVSLLTYVIWVCTYATCAPAYSARRYMVIACYHALTWRHCALFLQSRIHVLFRFFIYWIYRLIYLIYQIVFQMEVLLSNFHFWI